MNFQLKADFKPTGDQPEAIKILTDGVHSGVEHQVLLGVTGSGKTFTVASVIEKLQMPTLVISHNKTLAAQLYQELRDFFPKNGVSYFVSYYDYYQPEAYIPQTDTYIEKETDINEEIDKLRLRATTNILTRKDVIVVASVSCIYNLGSPREYGHFVLELKVGKKYERQNILQRLVDLQYARGEFGFHRGTFRVRGNTLDIFPAYEDNALRLEFNEDILKRIVWLDPLTGKTQNAKRKTDNTLIYPAKHYMTDPKTYNEVLGKIRKDLRERIQWFKKKGKEVEAQRLERRVNYDLEMIQEVGYVNGIENYSRYFDGRKPGEPPYSLLDYYREAYGEDFLVVIDESHMTVPQIRGMYNGDRARKETLIGYGFRLPAAYDNRPLKFEEFLRRAPRFIYTSATPAKWELGMAGDNGMAEQFVRPTGIPDPEIETRKTLGQIDDLIGEIEKRAKNGQRVLVTTLTKRMAEDLTAFLQEKGLRAHYLHSEIKTLDRSDILDDLRLGRYDVLIGINLLREGLDLPEVSLVAILDADKEGFLRSETSLIQVMGRAARHIEGKVIMYADEVTGSMRTAIAEVERRRKIQLEYNKRYGITPKTIVKPIREKLVQREVGEPVLKLHGLGKEVITRLEEIDLEDMTPYDRKKFVGKLRRAMNSAARDLNFELAARFRDKINELAYTPGV